MIYKVQLWFVKLNTSSSYVPYQANSIITINGSQVVINTSASLHNFTWDTPYWETISGYDDNFGIRINCRRNWRNTATYQYIYDSEIEVTYTIPDPPIINTTLKGNGISSITSYDREEFELTINHTNKSDR